jgi:predicted alpha/beta-hydrolase family hydrolase
MNMLNRIRSEYLEMPGLTLKSEQLQRLCGIDHDACQQVLSTLVEAGFLSVREDGSYARSRDVETSRTHPAKASLESRMIMSMTRLRRRAS